MKNEINIKSEKGKNKFLTQKDFEDLCLDIHKENVNSFIKYEKNLLEKYPQNDVKEDYHSEFEKNNALLKMVFNNNLLINIFITYRYLKTNFGYYSFANFIRSYLLLFCATTPIFMVCVYFENSTLGLYSDKGMNFMTKNELYTKRLIEKVDIYDSVDSILNLKDRYSLYELNQMKKEEYRLNESIVSQNMSNFVAMTTMNINLKDQKKI